MDFIKRYKNLIITEILLVIIFILTYGRFGDVMVDSFREAYIPAEILQGKILYKNIFTIYAPFAYLFNAALLWIFGVKQGVLFGAGLTATMGIFYFTYQIAKIFLENKYVSIIMFFMVAGLVLSPNGFNAFFPYSYGILYGLFFILVSIWAALNKKYPIAFLMYSFAICSKYEFLLFLPLLIWASGKKDIFKNIIAFIIPLCINFVPLFIQKADFFTSFELITQMCTTYTLKWFYSVMGLSFRPEHLIVYGINILKLVVPAALFMIPKLNRIFTGIILIIPFWFLSYQDVLVYLFPLITLLFIFRFREFKFNEKFFIMASILISIKVFWGFTLQAYGVFFIPFGLIALLIVIPAAYRKNIAAVLLLWGIVTAGHNIYGLKCKNVNIVNSPIKTTSEYGTAINKVNQYILKNSQKDDMVVVYPECLAVNVITGRKTDDKFYSLIPMYVETFGEDLIIKRLEIIKPEFVIISNYDTSLYYYKEFGQDYGMQIKNYVEKYYKQEKVFPGDLTFEIYRRI